MKDRVTDQPAPASIAVTLGSVTRGFRSLNWLTRRSDNLLDRWFARAGRVAPCPSVRQARQRNMARTGLVTQRVRYAPVVVVQRTGDRCRRRRLRCRDQFGTHHRTRARSEHRRVARSRATHAKVRAQPCHDKASIAIRLSRSATRNQTPNPRHAD